MINKGDPLPAGQSAARYCAPRELDELQKITSASFMPRLRDQGKLSATWVQCVHPQPGPAQVAGVRNVLAHTVQAYTASGKIGILFVDEIRALRKNERGLDVVYWPSLKNNCLSTIERLDGAEEYPFASRLADLANARDPW